MNEKEVGIVIYKKKDGSTRIEFDKNMFKKMFKKAGVIEIIPAKEDEVYASIAIENWTIKGRRFFKSKKSRTAIMIIDEDAESIQSIGVVGKDKIKEEEKI